MKGERGFTLIELLVVLAIMGVLVGITALSVTGLIGSSKETAMKSEKDQVQTAIDVYNTEKALGDDCCTSSITAQATPVQVAPTGAFSQTHGQFLRRTTKYLYKWGANGTPITVCHSVSCTIHYP